MEMPGGKVRWIVYSILLLASLACAGFVLAGFSKANLSHQILLNALIPQYQYALEMERTARQRQKTEFLQARAGLLETMEPDQSLQLIEMVSLAPPDAVFVREQILPQISGRIRQLHSQHKRILDQIWVAFLAVILLNLAWFSGLAMVYWRRKESEERPGTRSEEIVSPVRRLSSTLRQFAGDSRVLEERLNRRMVQENQVIELSDQLQGSLNQVEGVLGLVDDATGVAARNSQETAERLKQTQDKLFNVLTLMQGMTERTERMRVLAEGLSDLADQANLFLVNTSLEIASQEESGRGFSAVAEEVSNLADGSVKTSQELIQLIRQINEEASQKVFLLQQEIGSFAATHQVVARTEQSFMDLSRMVDHLCDQASVIQKRFQQLFLESRSLKETNSELAQIQQKWNQCLAISRKSVDQLINLLPSGVD